MEAMVLQERLEPMVPQPILLRLPQLSFFRWAVKELMELVALPEAEAEVGAEALKERAALVVSMVFPMAVEEEVEAMEAWVELPAGVEVEALAFIYITTVPEPSLQIVI